jgi:hypothetical protein
MSIAHRKLHVRHIAAMHYAYVQGIFLQTAFLLASRRAAIRVMAEMECPPKCDKTEAIQAVIQMMTEAEEAEFKLEMEKFVAESTVGKTAAEKERWNDGWLWAKKNLGLMQCAEAVGWRGQGCKGCKDLHDAKKRALDAEVKEAQDAAIAIRRAMKNPRLEERVQVIQGNCSSSSSGVLCCEECARAASG